MSQLTYQKEIAKYKEIILNEKIATIRQNMYRQIAILVILFSALFHLAGMLNYAKPEEIKQVAAYRGVHLEGEIKIARRSPRIEDLLIDTQNKGGILIQCFRNQCYDTLTAQNYGGGKDGYYIVFPNNDGKATEKAKQISQQLLALSD